MSGKKESELSLSLTVTAASESGPRAYAMAGISAADIDVAELTPSVPGYVTGRQTTVRGAIEPLAQAYFFDAAESDDTLMEKYFSDPDSLTEAEIMNAIRISTINMSITPILCGSAFWGGLLDWVRERLAGEGMINPDDLDLLQLIDEPKEIVETIFRFYETRGFDTLPEEREQLLNL